MYFKSIKLRVYNNLLAALSKVYLKVGIGIYLRQILVDTYLNTDLYYYNIEII